MHYKNNEWEYNKVDSTGWSLNNIVDIRGDFLKRNSYFLSPQKNLNSEKP